MLSGVPRRIVVIGHDEIGRRTAGMLRDAQADVIHLDEPTDAELREILDRGADGVAVMLHDDIKALRYCLVVHHLDPELPLFVAMFDRTARAQLERVVPECVVLSPASISVPAFVDAIVGPPAGDDAERVPPSWRRRGRVGRLAGQLRPYDPGSSVLLVGVVGLLLVTVIDTFVGIAHVGLIRALYDATRTTATISSPEAPDDPLVLVWASVAAILVMAFTAMFAAGLVNYLLSGRTVTLLGRRVAPRSGHVIVVGMGQVGLRLAQELKALGIAVLGIEVEPHARLLPIARRAGIPVLIGDATSRDLLMRARIGHCVALVAAGSLTRDNIAVAVSALALNPEASVILRAGTDDAIDETRSLFHIGSVVDVNGLTAGFVTSALVRSPEPGSESP